MKILVTGATGFIGSALTKNLADNAHQVFRLIRPPAIAHRDDILWNPKEKYIEKSKLSGLNAVIHLAGENIFGLWTNRKKARIYDSRIHGTKLIAQTISNLNPPPQVFICASAVGYYSDTDSDAANEKSPPGNKFLSRLCIDWENAACTPAEKNIRTINLRLSIVLDKTGGALSRMLPLFKCALGAKMGNGSQYLSWITLKDLLRVVDFILKNDSISGPINAASPNPVTNAQFTKILATNLKRPALLKIPAPILKFLLGQFAEEVFLSSIKAAPEKLLNAGFTFEHPDLETAFHQILIKHHSQKLKYKKSSKSE